MEEVLNELKKLDASVQDTHSKLAATVARQESEMETLGGVSAETKSQLTKLEQRYDQEVADIKGQNQQLKDEVAELKSLQAEYEAKRNEVFEDLRSSKRKSVASLLEQPAYKGWHLESGHGSPTIQVGRFDDFVGPRSRKNITGGAALNQVLGRTEWTEIVGENFIEDDHLRNYMNVVEAEGHSVAFVERTVFDNGAAFQVEGQLKENSSHTFVARDAAACVLAHTAQISKQQMRSTPAVVGFMEDELFRGVLHKESIAVLFSDGSPGNLRGITHTPGIQTYNRHRSGDTKILALRRSETQLQGKYTSGTLYVVNHNDWEEIETDRDSEGRFIWVQVQVGGTQVMWRKPVFVTPAMAEGTFLNGDFAKGATLIDFEQANVAFFPSHADFAKRNLVLARAEETIGLAVKVPSSFVYGAYDGGSGSGSGS